MLGFSEGVEEPLDLGGFEGLFILMGGVAGDAGGDAAAAGFGVLGLAVAVGDGEDLFEHLLELAAFEAYWGGFDGEGAGGRRVRLRSRCGRVRRRSRRR